MEEAVCFDAKEMIQDRLKINANGEEKISGVCSRVSLLFVIYL